MALGKVLARGQVTLPRQIRRAAGFEPGDVVSFQLTEQGAIEIRALPRLRLSEALTRYRIEGPIEDAADRARWQVEAAEAVAVLQPGLTLEDAQRRSVATGA